MYIDRYERSYEGLAPCFAAADWVCFANDEWPLLLMHMKSVTPTSEEKLALIRAFEEGTLKRKADNKALRSTLRLLPDRVAMNCPDTYDVLVSSARNARMQYDYDLQTRVDPAMAFAPLHFPDESKEKKRLPTEDRSPILVEENTYGISFPCLRNCFVLP